MVITQSLSSDKVITHNNSYNQYHIILKTIFHNISYDYIKNVGA